MIKQLSTWSWFFHLFHISLHHLIGFVLSFFTFFIYFHNCLETCKLHQPKIPKKSQLSQQKVQQQKNPLPMVDLQCCQNALVEFEDPPPHVRTQNRKKWNPGCLMGILILVCFNPYITTWNPMTSIFEGQPPKTRPFPIKTRVIWVPGR